METDAHSKWVLWVKILRLYGIEKDISKRTIRRYIHRLGWYDYIAEQKIKASE
jgi:hypothetical protein